jgi:hypothetical protein
MIRARRSAALALPAVALSVLLAAGAAGPASAAITTAVPAAATVAATPFPGRTPAQVLSLSTSTMKRASSVHFRLHAAAASSVTDIDMTMAASSARGYIADSAKGKATLIRIGSKLWLSGDAKYWATSGSTKGAALVGKWVLVGSTFPGYKDLRALTTIAYWATQIAVMKPTAFVAGKVVNRLATIGLQAPDGTTYVATRGKAYPLLITSGANNADTMTLTNWNKRITVSAPPAKLVIKV